MVEPGIIFFVGLLGLTCLFLRRAAMIEALERHGVMVVATVTSIEPHAMFTRVTARLSAPQDMAGLPLSLLDAVQPAHPSRKASMVQVLVDPANYQRYSMHMARERSRMGIWHETHRRASVPNVRVREQIFRPWLTPSPCCSDRPLSAAHRISLAFDILVDRPGKRCVARDCRQFWAPPQARAATSFRVAGRHGRPAVAKGGPGQFHQTTSHASF